MDPVTLGLALAMSAGGKLWEGSQKSSYANAIARARMGELDKHLDRQGALGKESRGTFDTALGGFSQPSQTAKLAGAQDSRTGNILGNMTTPTDEGINLPGSAPGRVRKTVAGRLLDQFQKATAMGRAKGALGGYGDAWQGNSMGLTDANRRIGTTANFSGAETGLLPQAQHLAEIQAGAQNMPSIWPQILQAGGQMLGMYGGSGGGFGGSGATMMPSPHGGYAPMFGR